MLNGKEPKQMVWSWNDEAGTVRCGKEGEDKLGKTGIQRAETDRLYGGREKGSELKEGYKQLGGGLDERWIYGMLQDIRCKIVAWKLRQA